MVPATTIRMSGETKALLDGLKQNPRETYDDVVRRLAQMAYDHEPLTIARRNRCPSIPQQPPG